MPVFKKRRQVAAILQVTSIAQVFFGRLDTEFILMSLLPAQGFGLRMFKAQMD